MRTAQRRNDARTERRKDAKTEGRKSGRTRGRRGAPRESRDALRERAAAILARLKAEYPDAHCELDYRTPYQLLVATILSAQCTDVRVNMVTPAFFACFPQPRMLAVAHQADVESLIRSTGFFRNKAKSLIGMARALVERHGGEVPRDMAALRVLPGVGRKTANVVLGNAFGLNEGITVDTHVVRLARLLKLTRQTTPEKIERDLMPLVPRDDWALVSHLLIWHGRRVCIARRPKCGECVLARLCPSARVPEEQRQRSTVNGQR
jgi:endonuclease-3